MPKTKKRLEKKVKIGNKRVSVYGFSAFEIQQKIEALQNAEAYSKDPLFTDVMDSWQEKHFEEIAPGTRTCYTPAIKRATAEFSGVKLSEITPMDVTALLRHLATQGYSLQTVKIQKLVISLVFDFAQSRGIIQYNPAEHAELPPKLPKKKREIPDDDIIDKVMKSSDASFGMFPFFLLLTGCRRGEALALRWSDINFEKKTLNINKNIIYEGNKPTISHHTKTQAGMRKVVLLDVLIEKLLDFKGDSAEDDYVFGVKDRPYSQTEFKRRWDKYKKETGIDITPHQLRHAYATILFDAKVDEKVAQSFMGHSKIEITRNIYTHIRQQRATQAQDDLNNFINKMI